MLRGMSWTSKAVLRTDTQWTVQAEHSSGEAASLTYATEAQARYFAAVLALRPAVLPKQAIVRTLAQLPLKEAVKRRRRNA